MMRKIKELYNTARAASEKLKSGEQALIILALVAIVPVVFFNFIYPAREFSVKKHKNACENSRARFDKLKAGEDLMEARIGEMESGKSEINHVNGLILGSDAAVQLLNSITNFVEKNTLEIKFLKKHARFDRIYEKTYMPKDANGNPEESSRIVCRILPVEVVFRSRTADFILFVNYIEGFKKLNFAVRKLSASKMGDGRIEAVMIVEMILEVKYTEGGNG